MVEYKKRLITRRVKKEKMELVARRGQPQAIARVPVLKKADVGGRISSSWIAELLWDNSRNVAIMILIIGYVYDVFIPFKIFRQWFYAVSKGTYFNYNIKDKFVVKRWQ
jgi:hypothetical protein